MKIIIGLGNPGEKYQLTRHNLGFMMIDKLAESIPFQKKHQSLTQKNIFKSHTILLVKPQTFMNLSGQAVQQIISFYKSSLEDLLVIQDDKDLSFETMKFQKSRGHGGHNGIRNIHQALQTKDYCRLKMGVASIKINNKLNQSFSSLEQEEKRNPLHFSSQLENQSTSEFVLAPFTQEEQKQLPDFLERGKQAIHYWITESCEKASNYFNSQK